MKTKKYRIKSKLRFTVFAASVLVSFVFLSGSILGLNDASSLSGEPGYVSVQIETGDTLWELASHYGPPNVDRRQIVYEICQVNKLQADSIQPGQTILIPKEI